MFQRINTEEVMSQWWRFIKMSDGKYVLTEDCFLGGEGDIIEVSLSHHDSEYWTNLNRNTTGSPVGPDWKCMARISE